METLTINESSKPFVSILQEKRSNFSKKNISAINRWNRYKDTHKDIVLERQAEYRLTDKYKESRKKWLEDHADYMKLYRKENTDWEKYYAKQQERLVCDLCGKTFPRQHKQDHLRSKKHLAVVTLAESPADLVDEE